MSDTTAKQPHQINAADSANVRLVQITDCHIFATAEDCLQGLNTRQSFASVSDAVVKNLDRLDLLLATGDLSQDGTSESYAYLAQEFDSMGIPTFWLPGNHDDSDAMEAHFAGKCIHASSHVLIGNWQIVLLDSTIKGEVCRCVERFRNRTVTFAQTGSLPRKGQDASRMDQSSLDLQRPKISADRRPATTRPSCICRSF